MRITGIDFGAKMAGTTSICSSENGNLSFVSAKKGVDADEFILRHIEELMPSVIGIDAPLSLPIAYQKGSSGTDFMYRLADRELGAMSPMFLGGLTARAMSIAVRLRAYGVTVVEVYPRATVRLLTDYEESYVVGKRANDISGIETLSGQLRRVNDLALPIAAPANWHELDSLIALLSTVRFVRNEAVRYGDPEEGIIHV